MVHVSMVSGTPLGLRDMTVISQISDRWRDGPVGPRRSHNFHTSARCHPNGTDSSLHRVSPRPRVLLSAIYTSLSLKSVNSLQDKPLRGGGRTKTQQWRIPSTLVALFLFFRERRIPPPHLPRTNLNIRPKLTSPSIFFLSSWCRLVLLEKENSSTGP